MKFTLVAALVVLCAVASQAHPTTRTLQWNLFLARHNKSYNAETEAYCRAIWEAKMNIIEKHNAEADQGIQSYYLTDNIFSDMTEEELAAYRKTMTPVKKNPFVPVFTGVSAEERKTFADSVDYTKDPCMGTPKDQAQCGSCWSFGATNPIEFLKCKKNGDGKALNLSEQQMVDCSVKFGNFGCNGGWYTNAWDYIIDAGGQMTTKDYPYVAKEHVKCAFDASKVAVSLTGYTNVEEMNEDALFDAVAKVGPVAVAIQAGLKFQLYTHGVYDDKSCPTDGKTVDHAVVVVGYGNDAASGKDYWIVRNSWGPGWGESGYIRMKRGVNMCNIAMAPAYPAIA